MQSPKADQIDAPLGADELASLDVRDLLAELVNSSPPLIRLGFSRRWPSQTPAFRMSLVKFRWMCSRGTKSFANISARSRGSSNVALSVERKTCDSRVCLDVAAERRELLDALHPCESAWNRVAKKGLLGDGEERKAEPRARFFETGHVVSGASFLLVTLVSLIHIVVDVEASPRQSLTVWKRVRSLKGAKLGLRRVEQNRLLHRLLTDGPHAGAALASAWRAIEGSPLMGVRANCTRRLINHVAAEAEVLPLEGHAE